MPTPRGSPTKSVDSGESNVSAMLDLRNGRKRAEADLQLLSNRLALLRNEESRAMTKITETKNRAKEILVMKKKNEESNKHRTAKLLGNDDVSRLAKDKVAKAKADRNNKKEATKKLIEDNRRRVANSIKEDSKRYARVYCTATLVHATHRIRHPRCPHPHALPEWKKNPVSLYHPLSLLFAPTAPYHPQIRGHCILQQGVRPGAAQGAGTGDPAQEGRGAHAYTHAYISSRPE